ncbi:LysR family transcriptional regulator, partial [Alkalihalophilus pseudofirmus]|nr:LysR family transcriptional regulator [Alkalihalophilus pseudofirmus]
SHSAISQSLSSLESELGLIIFKRSHSGTICTEEGKKVLALAYDIINKVNELKELGYKASMLKGTLKIAASSIFFTTLLP